ncbi:hypothetical protein L9F63_020558 [Diploptera punctata]|uniref:SAYSvFN domain-containing protein n=1 Tax=Diploptera punctata TaxID=6984 RepID=A0AAD8ECU3_DIPPU|nr:hypothetical protein L9F63_020558 [Diploptera punctata]
MDVKLAEYRARKRKEETKQLIYNMIFNSRLEEETNNVSHHAINQEDEDKLISSADDDSAPSYINDPELTTTKFNWLTIANYILYSLLWATLYAIAIQMEFGAVFLIVSILYGIWSNTRTRPKQEGEVSAYSVFNPNCEAIHGTLNAEQFEREIRYGAVSVH